MKRQTRRSTVVRWVAVVAAMVLLLAACSGSGGKGKKAGKIKVGPLSNPTTTAVLSNQGGPSTPAVHLISPTSGRGGTEVSIDGTGLNNVTAIHLGPLSVFFVVKAGGDLINAYVPGAAAAGALPFELTYPKGTVATPTFTVVPKPPPSTTTTVPKHKTTTTTSTTVPKKHKTTTTTTSTTVPKHKTTTTTTSTTVPKHKTTTTTTSTTVPG